MKKQKTKANFEIFVVDNDSDDDTKEIASGFKVNYFFVSRSVSDRPRNFAIPKARGRIISFIDDDAIADKMWIQNIIDWFDRSPKNIAVIGGLIDNLPNGVIATANHIFDFGNFYGKHERLVRTVPTCNASFRRDIFKLEKFDDSLFIGEDVDLNWRIKKRGFKIVYCPTIKVLHRSNNKIREFIKKGVLRGSGFAKIREKHKDIPLQIPKNKYLYFLLLPAFIVGGFFRSLKNEYLIARFLLSLSSIPLFFLAHIFFWIGVTMAVGKK